MFLSSEIFIFKFKDGEFSFEFIGYIGDMYKLELYLLFCIRFVIWRYIEWFFCFEITDIFGEILDLGELLDNIWLVSERSGFIYLENFLFESEYLTLGFENFVLESDEMEVSVVMRSGVEYLVMFVDWVLYEASLVELIGSGVIGISGYFIGRSLS